MRTLVYLSIAIILTLAALPALAEELTPGESFTVSFPELPHPFHGHTSLKEATMKVTLPDNYTDDPCKKFGVFIYLNGGHGAPMTLSWLTDNKDFIHVGLSYFTDLLVNGVVQDFSSQYHPSGAAFNWEQHEIMLNKLQELIPNIDSNRDAWVLGGFSNGGHLVGYYLFDQETLPPGFIVTPNSPYTFTTIDFSPTTQKTTPERVLSRINNFWIHESNLTGTHAITEETLHLIQENGAAILNPGQHIPILSRAFGIEIDMNILPLRADGLHYPIAKPILGTDGYEENLQIRDEFLAWVQSRATITEDPSCSQNTFQLCDVNRSGECTSSDIDVLSKALRENSKDSSYDLNLDGMVNHLDREYLVRNLFHSFPGDTNLNGILETRDIIQALQSGEFEDQIPHNSTWDEGDWNGDGDFETGDLIMTFQEGNSVQ